MFASAQQSILNLTIKDKSALHAAYMSFVSTGGLFIPTSKRYQLGDQVFMLLRLMNEPERIPIAGRVAWITPSGAEGNRTVGVGIQFSDQDGGLARKKIEAHLAGSLNADRSTHTM